MKWLCFSLHIIPLDLLRADCLLVRPRLHSLFSPLLLVLRVYACECSILCIPVEQFGVNYVFNLGIVCLHSTFICVRCKRGGGMSGWKIFSIRTAWFTMVFSSAAVFRCMNTSYFYLIRMNVGKQCEKCPKNLLLSPDALNTTVYSIMHHFRSITYYFASHGKKVRRDFPPSCMRRKETK